MGSAGQEGDVLKLVHPRGYVEIHTKPITAAEVMKKNPRHCVTRPDVFKFPWIVVRPDSVLKLGTVFFIVPNHTLHRLLHAAKARRQDSFSLKQQSRIGDENSNQESIIEQWLELPPELQKSSYDSWADATPKQRDSGRGKQQSQVSPCTEINPKPTDMANFFCGKKPIHGLNSKQQSRYDSRTRTTQLPLQSPKRCNEETSKSQIRDQRLRKHSPDIPWQLQQNSKQAKEQSSTDSLVEKKSSTDKALDIKNGKATVGLIQPPKQDSDLPKLKSCLRKPENKATVGLIQPPKQDSDLLKLKSCLCKTENKDRSRRRRLKVRFTLPSEEDKFVEDVKFMTL